MREGREDRLADTTFQERMAMPAKRLAALVYMRFLKQMQEARDDD